MNSKPFREEKVVIHIAALSLQNGREGWTRPWIPCMVFNTTYRHVHLLFTNNIMAAALIQKHTTCSHSTLASLPGPILILKLGGKKIGPGHVLAIHQNLVNRVTVVIWFVVLPVHVHWSDRVVMAHSAEFCEVVAYSLRCVHLESLILKAKQEEALYHL